MKTVIAFTAGWALACVAMNQTRRLDRTERLWAP